VLKIVPRGPDDGGGGSVAVTPIICSAPLWTDACMMESSRQECAVPRECQNDGDEDHTVFHACSCIVHAMLNSGKDVSSSYWGECHGVPRTTALAGTCLLKATNVATRDPPGRFAMYFWQALHSYSKAPQLPELPH
jgi:hypothetical protein